MKYHNIDSSPFGVMTKLCFDQDGVDAILGDLEIDYEINAFDLGCAETHFVTDGTDHSVIIVIVNLNRCGSTSFTGSIVAHEAYHVVCRIFQHVGQPLVEAGEEVVAYMIEHITKQIFGIVERELNVRKASRSVPKQTGKRARRAVV